MAAIFNHTSEIFVIDYHCVNVGGLFDIKGTDYTIVLTSNKVGISTFSYNNYRYLEKASVMNGENVRCCTLMTYY